VTFVIAFLHRALLSLIPEWCTPVLFHIECVTSRLLSEGLYNIEKHPKMISVVC